MDLSIGYTQTIVKECRKQGLTQQQTAYVIATAYWETARSMKPIKETVMPHHKDRNPSDATVIARLDRAFAAGLLGQVRNPYWRDGWFGRGFVQLTHKANYERAGRELGVALVANPDLAMRPDISAKILVRGMMQGWFTGLRLDQYVNSTMTDYVNARRVVNGLDRTEEIAGYARQYERVLPETVTQERMRFIEWLRDIFARFR